MATDATTHESIKDPVLKLARAIPVFESNDPRRIAKRDAEIALGRSIRECEEEESAQKAARKRARTPPVEPRTADLFERVRQERVDPLPTKNW